MSSWSEESIRGKAVREQETVARLVRAGKEGERQGTYSKRLGKESLTCWTFPSRYEVRDDVRWSNYSQNLRKTILVSILIDMVALVSVVLPRERVRYHGTWLLLPFLEQHIGSPIGIGPQW